MYALHKADEAIAVAEPDIWKVIYLTNRGVVIQ